MLDVDLNIKLDKNGVRIEVKKINPNDFIIDKVFKKLDKKSKKKEEKEEKLPVVSNDDKPTNTDDDCYVIEINV